MNHSTRACGTGGAWEAVEGGDGIPYWVTEMKAFLEMLSGSDRAVMVAELKARLQRAERGDLIFGPDDDVDFMVATRDIFEIRLHDTTTADEVRFQSRLFFAEPARRSGVLVAVKFIWKHPGAMGVRYQTRRAKQAQSVYDLYDLRRRSAGLA